MCLKDIYISLSVVSYSNFAECDQGIIDLTGTETFAKEPKLAKLLRKSKLKPVRCHKKVLWFFLYVCALGALGALLRDNLQMGAFSYHRFIFLLACVNC